VDRLLGHLRGFTLLEAEKTLTRAIVEDGALTLDAIEHVVDAKRRVVEQDGLLEYHPAEAGLDRVADLAGFKGWLAARTAVVTRPGRARERGLPFPRGVLLLGVPGCGKSLAAKAVSAEWGLPLLRFDPSTLYNKYIGETEKNLHRVLSRAEALDVVLLLDEGDALLGGRTEVRTANDRYANLETNYLLQRLEGYQGIVVVTTNLGDNIDSAFQRRMDVVVPFLLPRAEERWRILDLHLPDDHAVPVALLERIANSCQLSGGQLRNAALHASLLALDEGAGAVAARHLEAAIGSEYRKAGAAYSLGAPARRGGRHGGLEGFLGALAELG